jgi:phosphoribosyl-AMP cyclohydrolase / phosphoribosyl-ATP pyrophosphohydrolase
MTLDPALVAFDDAGLVPAIVQDANDGRVLMLGYMDAEALTATIDTGDVHFHSRSRSRLWRKGETSGHTLRVVDLAVDCDADALLVRADAVGPTCHRETRSCFDPEGSGQDATTQGFAWLESLWATIDQRAADQPEGSYTATLLDAGTDAVARKVTEEATEVLLAAKDDATASTTGADRARTRAALGAEAADLLFHLLVLLRERDLRPRDVIETLRSRADRGA